MTHKHILTPAGYQELNEKLHRLEARREALIERLDGMNVIRDEPEDSFYQAKREREDVELRIANIRQQLANVTIFDGAENPDVISVGNRVTIYSEDHQTQLVFDVIGTIETPTTATAVTEDSPVGSALLGKRVDEAITIETSQGEAHYRIEKIEQMPNPKA